MTITFSNATIAAYAISGTVFLIAGLLYFILWKKRTKAPVFPIVTGAVTFLLFALGLKVIPLYPLMMADNAVSHTVNSTPWLLALVGGLSAGIFEETGRLLAFRTVLKKYPDKRTALDYGIGHGGIELIYSAFITLGYAAMGIMVNQNGADALLGNTPDYLKDTFMATLESKAALGFEMLPLGVMERAGALMIHLAFSVMVFRAAHDKKSRWLYPAAILLHAAADASIVLLADHVLLTEILFIVFAAVMLFISVRKVYRNTPSAQEVCA
ncbi:MAG: YhfC family intramembrane metalloprotease [Oscillospiraceae bacterium]|nr:YhfC family intramembrane metalloprotease [Oscillospiraceae bacterium]